VGILTKKLNLTPRIMFRIYFNMNTQVEDADAVFIGKTENPEDVMNIMEADFSKRFGDDSVLTDDLYSVYFHDMQYDELYEVYPTDETCKRWE